MIKYSIIMPVYNSEKTITKSIMSVINQSYQNWELVVVDDGSTDKSYEIIKKIASNDSRVKLHRQNNSGPGVARNMAIKESKGEYIAFLDSDDYWDYDFLKIVENMNKNGQYDLIFWDRIYETPEGKVIKYSNIYSLRECDKDKILRKQTTGLIPWGMSKVIKRKIINDNISFSKLTVGEEAIFSYEVLKKAKNIGFIEKPIYHYVQNSNGQHTKGKIDPWWDVVKTMKNHMESKKEYDLYINTINSFALRSLCISVYRCFCNMDYKIAKTEIKKLYNKYNESYDFNNFDEVAIDRTSKIILFLLKNKFFFVLFILSKIRNKKKK